MDTYSLLREFADSWVLLAMFSFFLAVVLWVFRPGTGTLYRDISNIPLRDDAAPVPPAAGCRNCKNGGNCAAQKGGA